MATVRLFKIGADPELGFLDREGRIVEAGSVMTRVRHSFGLDGCTSIAEMRPAPSINPAQVVQNLYKDFLQGYYANPKLRELYWKAGSSLADGNDNFGIGGHIHFGIHGVTGRTIFDGRLAYYRDLVLFLDTYLAQVGRLLDSPVEMEERMEEYGYLGDFRTNGHGLEYRTLGSWLTSPRVAEGILCLAQTVVYQHLWETANKRKVRLDRLAPLGARRCDCSDDCEDVDGEETNDIRRSIRQYKKKFPTLRDNIRGFKLYRQHEVPIEFIFKLIEKNKTWFPGEKVDVKVAWGVSTEHTFGKAIVIPNKVLPAVKFDDIWKRASV